MLPEPTPEDLRAAAKKAGLTGGQAAALLNANPRTWRRWVGGERSCSAATYFALLVLTDQHPEYGKRERDDR